MRVVPVHAPGCSHLTTAPLAAAVEGHLVAHFAAGQEDAATTALLRDLWMHRQWVACDCRSSASSPPLLFVRRLEPLRYALVRMADRPPHAQHCPFAKPPALAAAADDAQLSMPAHEALLLRWIATARLNVIYPCEQPDQLHSQFEALREAARNLEIEPGRRLYEFSRTHSDGLALLERRLTSAGARGVYLARVDALTDTALRDRLRGWGTIASPFAELPLTDIQLSAGCLTGPFLVLFEFTPGRSPTGWAVRVAAQPIFSREHLVPLEGERERQTLRALIELQQRLLRARGSIMTIRKTLPGTHVHERGISFQVQRLGPNGRASRTIDIVSLPEPGKVPATAPGGAAHYHATGLDSSVQAWTDQVFRRALETSLWDGTERSSHRALAGSAGAGPSVSSA